MTTTLEQIEETEITESCVLRAEAWVEQYANTTAALTALAAVLRDTYKDSRGANLVLGFALDTFAPHEAATL